MQNILPFLQYNKILNFLSPSNADCPQSIPLENFEHGLITNPTQNTELQSCNIPKGYISKKVPIKFSEVLAEYLSKRQAYSSGFLEIHATKKNAYSPIQ